MIFLTFMSFVLKSILITMSKVKISPFTIYLNDIRPSNNYLNPPVTKNEKLVLQTQYNQLPNTIKQEYERKADTQVTYKF